MTRIATHRQGDLVEISLVQPTLTQESVLDLLAALDAAEADTVCRTVALTGDATTFCRGLDLPGGEVPSWMTADVNLLWQLLQRLRTTPLVTVAVVEGVAVGGGVGVAAACDLVVAGPEASFQLTEVVLGLIPATILPFVAARVGGHRAYRLALTADRVEASHAVHIGLADLADEPRNGLRTVRRSLRRGDRAAQVALKRYQQVLQPVTSTAAAATTALSSLADSADGVRRRTAVTAGGRVAS